ncbi:MAG: DnaJ domain-containing protein [Alphaproteobacteria bacterium]|nr:DnaJ domain-containing protein [Alphaproteobacteria bacterium]
MKLDSKFFDTIRIKPRHAAKPAHELAPCEWEGCDRPGPYKAPKGWRAAGEFHHFCIEHVRLYNQTFDFFEGAGTDKIDEMSRKAAATGERPTWETLSARQPGARPRSGDRRHDYSGKKIHDPLNLFARLARRKGTAGAEPSKPQRSLAEPDRRALETLGLDGMRPTSEIKKAYKDLVKTHHPDANGGSKASEDRLRAVIMAYTHLKQKGLV